MRYNCAMVLAFAMLSLAGNPQQLADRSYHRDSGSTTSNQERDATQPVQPRGNFHRLPIPRPKKGPNGIVIPYGQDPCAGYKHIKDCPVFYADTKNPGGFPDMGPPMAPWPPRSRKVRRSATTPAPAAPGPQAPAPSLPQGPFPKPKPKHKKHPSSHCDDDSKEECLDWPAPKQGGGPPNQGPPMPPWPWASP